MSNNFLRIDNEFFRLKGTGDIIQTDFTLMDTEGFTIYSYLLFMQSSKTMTQVNIRMIKAFFGKDFTGIKDIITIEKYLKALHNNKFIEIMNIEELQAEKQELIDNKKIKKKIRVEGFGLDDILNIKVNTRSDKGFTAVPEDIFINEIRTIGHVSWSILCVLSWLFNDTFGGETCIGFANPSQNYIGIILKRHRLTIEDHMDILEKRKLIKVEKQPIIIIGYNKDDEPEYQFEANHYIVRFKDSENKYYIDFNTKK